MRLLCDKCGSVIQDELDPCHNCETLRGARKLSIPKYAGSDTVREIVARIRADRQSQNNTPNDIQAQDHIEPWDDDFDFD